MRRWKTVILTLGCIVPTILTCLLCEAAHGEVQDNGAPPHRGVSQTLCILVRVDPDAYRAHPDISGDALSQVEARVSVWIGQEMIRSISLERVESKSFPTSVDQVRAYSYLDAQQMPKEIDCSVTRSVVRLHIYATNNAERINADYDVIVRNERRSRNRTKSFSIVNSYAEGADRPQDPFGGMADKIRGQASQILSLVRSMDR
jgi:hypothetical protein